MEIQEYFTSEEILGAFKKDDPHLMDDAFSCLGHVKYSLTDSEKKWLSFVDGRYGIADYIHDNTDLDGVTTFCAEEFSRVLDDDGMKGKAVCLSDETALQAIFFLGYVESEA